MANMKKRKTRGSGRKLGVAERQAHERSQAARRRAKTGRDFTRAERREDVLGNAGTARSGLRKITSYMTSRAGKKRKK